MSSLSVCSGHMLTRPPTNAYTSNIWLVCYTCGHRLLLLCLLVTSISAPVYSRLLVLQSPQDQSQGLFNVQLWSMIELQSLYGCVDDFHSILSTTTHTFNFTIGMNIAEDPSKCGVECEGVRISDFREQSTQLGTFRTGTYWALAVSCRRSGKLMEVDRNGDITNN